MEDACNIIEKTVNAEMRKRKRFPLEWGGEPDDPDGQGFTWRANFAAANCYEGAKEAVGFHSDRLTSLGPYPTIASLSLGTSNSSAPGRRFNDYCRNPESVSPSGSYRAGRSREENCSNIRCSPTT
jgi:hypothetical protein